MAQFEGHSSPESALRRNLDQIVGVKIRRRGMRISHMYCGTLEVTARHPVPPQLLGGRLPHCCCLFRQEQPSGSQGTAATISLNASHGGTGDSQSGAGAVYTVSTCLLLTLGNLTGVQLYTKKQAIRMLSFAEIAVAIEKVLVIRPPRLCLGIL